jgi:hypothetical protein
LSIASNIINIVVLIIQQYSFITTLFLGPFDDVITKFYCTSKTLTTPNHISRLGCDYTSTNHLGIRFLLRQYSRECTLSAGDPFLPVLVFNIWGWLFRNTRFPEAPMLVLGLGSTVPDVCPWSDEKYSRMVGESEKEWEN